MLNAVRRLPWFRVLAVAEVAVLARRHLEKLTPSERSRLAELVRRARSLSPREREELRRLVAKLEPRAFIGGVAEAVAPVRLPRRITRGPKRRR